VLAALGERDTDAAAADPRPYDAAQCRIARRQAAGVLARSVVSGAVLSVSIWLILSRLAA
jgi:hypothetical protein